MCYLQTKAKIEIDQLYPHNGRSDDRPMAESTNLRKPVRELEGFLWWRYVVTPMSDWPCRDHLRIGGHFPIAVSQGQGFSGVCPVGAGTDPASNRPLTHPPHGVLLHRLCHFTLAARTFSRLHTPQVPPCFAQCPQYLQSLQALHGSLP